MIGNFTLALPCIADGHSKCLQRDLDLEGRLNFDQMAEYSEGNKKAYKMYRKMARVCHKGFKHLHCNKLSPPEVSRDVCKVLSKLNAIIEDTDEADCKLSHNILHVTNALAILEPKRLKKILSAPNLKDVIDVHTALKNLLT